jgi:hypothetical protein
LVNPAPAPPPFQTFLSFFHFRSLHLLRQLLHKQTEKERTKQNNPTHFVSLMSLGFLFFGFRSSGCQCERPVSWRPQPQERDEAEHTSLHSLRPHFSCTRNKTRAFGSRPEGSRGPREGELAGGQRGTTRQEKEKKRRLRRERPARRQPNSLELPSLTSLHFTSLHFSSSVSFVRSVRLLLAKNHFKRNQGTAKVTQ